MKHLFWYFRKFNFPDHRPSRLYWASSLILFQFYCPAILSIEQYNTIQSTIELSMLNCITLDFLYLTRNKGFIDDKISQYKELDQIKLDPYMYLLRFAARFENNDSRYSPKLNQIAWKLDGIIVTWTINQEHEFHFSIR